MILLPEDICSYILSFLPVKDPIFDHCINQLLYLFKCHEEYRNTTLFPSYINSSLVNQQRQPPYQSPYLSLQYKFILDKNRTKMCAVVYQYPSLYRKAFRKRHKRLKIQEKNNSQRYHELFEHRQILRQQLLLQQQNIVPGDLCTLKR